MNTVTSLKTVTSNVKSLVEGALAKSGGLNPREPQPAPVLLAMQEKVTRLVQEWRQPLADSIAAMNLFLDESGPRRAVAIEQMSIAVGGNCKAVGQLWAENALRGVWRMRGAAAMHRAMHCEIYCCCGRGAGLQLRRTRASIALPCIAFTECCQT